MAQMRRGVRAEGRVFTIVGFGSLILLLFAFFSDLLKIESSLLTQFLDKIRHDRVSTLRIQIGLSLDFL